MHAQDARETDAVTPAIDLEFLLDALSQPSHRKEAEKLFSQGVANGWVNEHHVGHPLSLVPIMRAFVRGPVGLLLRTSV